DTFKSQLSCDYSGMFSLNNYYLTDFQIFYDPLFDVYYIYTLDYYFGLRIVSMDFNYSFTPRYTLSLQDPGYSLAVCGSIMYVVLENTEIDQYLLKNWITPEFPSRIPPYSLEYSAVQGSLRCSSANFAKYLILQMKNNQGQIFLHVVDTLAKNMSNTVTDYLITDKMNDSIAYTEFLNNSGYLVIVNCSSWQIYLINAFQLVINTNYDCNKGDEQDFKIRVRNILNKTNSVDFKITISKYNQGKVKYGQIEIWQLALICIGAFLLLLLLFLCIRKKCLKHKSKVKTEALFEFEHKYEYIRAEFMNADIKINQSRSSF
ncbi:hypothetical protein M1146_04330, partial [Patescibacteria group bacterium]|nr:hypothetical protein [Patescibacteria group bacterium]